MAQFQDLGYKVAIKELKHSYDGYNPWVRKTKLDICESCMEVIVETSLSWPVIPQKKEATHD